MKEKGFYIVTHQAIGLIVGYIERQYRTKPETEFEEFLSVLRRALLMVGRWIEARYGLVPAPVMKVTYEDH